MLQNMILAGREIPGSLCNPNIQRRVKNILSLVPIMNHMNPVYVVPCKFQFNIILLSMQMVSVCPQVFRQKLCMSCGLSISTPRPSLLICLN